MADEPPHDVTVSTNTENAGGDSHGSTLFVSNLPYAATSTDLQTLFSDLAPVRTAFVVQEGNVSKGVGYVSFALKEDASKAMETIGTDGISLNGRNLRVQWADKKPKEKGEGKKVDRKASQKQVSTTPKQIVSAPKDPNAIRTIVISGLPSLIDHKTLWKKVRKCDGAESVTISEEGNGVGEIAHAVFSTPRAASHAVEKLHAHVFKGSLLSVTLKKRVEGLTKVKSDGKTALPAPARGSRLIIRNLPWNISDKDLKALFLPFGPIYSVHIPLANTEDGKQPKARGFAFVWFFSKKDAERAIEGVNGKSVVAGAISAPTMNKKERARLRRKLRESQGKPSEEDEEDGEKSDGDDDSPDGEPQAQNVNERIVAVDWALSKDKWEEAKAQGAEVDEEGEGSEGSDSEEEAEARNDSSESGSEASSSEGGDSDEPDAMDVDERSDDEVPTKPSLPAPEEGTTVFIRNVSFDSTEDDLRTLFRSFGPLRYARITMDHESGRSRGTGFACFWKKEDADKAVHQSELLNREAGLQEKSTKNPFSLPSILTPDPSSSLAQSLVLHGRTLHVTHAVTRNEAQKLKDEGERSREKADKRNLYLLREGVIFPNSPAASTVSPSELEKRLASFDARKGQLKSNPSLYVSKTRLSVRQIPLITTERALKRLANHAIRAFEQEVKSGTRQPLTEDELREDVPVEDVPNSDGEDAPKKDKKSGKRKRGERETKVRQAKIVRQSDRVDALIGKGRSKGYGFLELHKHADALRVLRWTNNNPEVKNLLEEWWKVELKELAESLEAALKDPKGKGIEGESKEDTGTRLKRVRDELAKVETGEAKTAKKTLAVEFSIENVQVVKRRNEHQKEKKEKTESTSNPKRRPSERQEGERPTKKRRVGPEGRKADNAPKRTVKSSEEREKAGQSIGSLIGRKRKARKAGKGS